MEFTHVSSQVPLPFTRLGAECALKIWNSTDVGISVLFHTVLLTKSDITHITLVWLFSCVYPDVPLQFKPVCCGVGAIRTLEWPLSSVSSHVPLQFGFLDTAVSTLIALKRLLLCVFILHVTI